MIKNIFLFVLFESLIGCAPKKETNKNIFITLPFSSRYYNWVNFEMKQLNFKIENDKLIIDTTYNLNWRNFKTHHIERIYDYPEITTFLEKSLTDYRDLQDQMNKKACSSSEIFYLQFENGTKLDRIEFKGAKECDPTDRETLSLVYKELERSGSLPQVSN